MFWHKNYISETETSKCLMSLPTFNDQWIFKITGDKFSISTPIDQATNHFNTITNKANQL